MKSSEYVLPLADPGATLETVGGKGASLARLVAAGLPVPDGFHVTTAAYRKFVVENDLQPGILAALEAVDIAQPATLDAASLTIGELFSGAQTPPDVASAIALAYASLCRQRVRSSPCALRPRPRTCPRSSFAGQQDTYLNIEGYGDVLEAVKRCWASLWTARAIGYRARHGIGPDGLSLAVVVQLLVPAEAAGILFTANPVTGRRDQAMISAAWGLGEAVVGGMVTPGRAHRGQGQRRGVERETADKQVMTGAHQWRHRGAAGPRGAAPRARARRAGCRRTGAAWRVQIEELYGMPMDIEWALADGAFAIVQARPITALPEEPAAPELELPDEWPLPDPKGPYMRGSIADLMPDPLTPLFATVGVPAINAGMKRTIRETIGGSLAALDNYLTTINDYAYLAREPGLPGLGVGVGQDGARPPAALAQWRAALARGRQSPLCRGHGPLARQAAARAEAVELLRGARELADAMADYLTALQVDAIGTAAGTEGLFTAIYDKMIKQEGDPPAPTLLLGADSTPIRAEKALYDLAQWCRERDGLAVYLLEAPSRQLAEQLDGDVPPGADAVTGPNGSAASATTWPSSGTASTIWTLPSRCRWTTRCPCWRCSRCSSGARAKTRTRASKSR